ncbi:MAG TPA: glycosyltransferase [Anaerolineales bacterium]|nr:glycosyltransferase [Anaerolineales bacterium]
MIYFYLSTILFIGGIFIVIWIHSQDHLDIVVKPTPPPADAPLISVCVPARNEERNIRRCVESILAQDYPNFEVNVLEDRSTDATAEILHAMESASSLAHDALSGSKEHAHAGSPPLQIINGADLPVGWAGKPHALFQASNAAHGKWLCFVDADTFLSPTTLSSCYAKAIETGAEMFTIMTFQVLGSFWEKAVMPIVMSAMSVGFSPRRVNDPAHRDAIANGQFILIKRATYDAIGGHERVKDQIVEDKAISEQVKWNGYRLVVADGYSVARTRMYTSLPEMWEGWTKNVYLGLSDRPSLLWLGAFGAFILTVAALVLPLWPLLGIIWYLQDGGWLASTVILESLVLWAIILYARARVATGMGISPWYAFTLPLGAAVFAAIMFASTWKVLSGKGVIWKGRTYKPK